MPASASLLPSFLLLAAIVRLAPLALAAPLQQPPATEVPPGSSTSTRPNELRRNDEQLGAPAAILDPCGALELRGRRSGGEERVRIAFPFLRWPPPGRYVVQASAGAALGEPRWPEHRPPLGAAPVPTGAGAAPMLGVAIVAPASADALLWCDGEVVVEAFGEERVRGRLRLRHPRQDEEFELTFDLHPTLSRLVPLGIPLGSDAAPAPAGTGTAGDVAAEDLLFCALGNTGSGLAGQRRVARALAALAERTPLDFVVLLGDNFLPHGVSSPQDPQFTAKFEDVYDPRSLPCEFWVVPGDLDHDGDAYAQAKRSLLSKRWKMPATVWSFERESHGKRIAVFGVDTTELLGDIVRPATRIAHRLLVQGIEKSPADWTIVCGHAPLYSYDHAIAAELQARMRERLEFWFDKLGVDLYLSSGPAALELVTPRDHVVQVVSGGGGGPELAEPVRRGDDTRFAATGGGFVCCRFDGEALELSFRDVDGRTLYVHRVSPRSPRDPRASDGSTGK